MVPVISEISSSEEIKTVALLADRIWHEHYSRILDPGQIDYMIGKYQSEGAIARQMKEEGYRYYLLRLGPEAIGYLGMKEEGRTLFLSKLYIARPYRGKGYSRAAFDCVQEYARRHALESVWLTVNRHNTESVAVYKAAGFSVVREEVTDIGNGYVMDDFIMEKKILSV